MGNICCGSKDEKVKAAAFQNSFDSSQQNSQDGKTSATIASDSTLHNNLFSNESDSMCRSNSQGLLSNDMNDHEQSRRKELEEKTRLDQIVQSIGRGMVSVRSTRGSTGYYDQGFAAALSQHLEQTTQFNKLSFQLPSSSTKPASYSNKNKSHTSSSTKKKSIASNATTSSSSNSQSNTSLLSASGDSSSAVNSTPDSVYARLSQPQWDGIQLESVSSNTAATTMGEDPNAFLDHIAESFLDEVIPKKERIFLYAKPIVENLL